MSTLKTINVLSTDTLLSTRRASTLTSIARVMAILGVAGLAGCAVGDGAEAPLGEGEQRLLAEGASDPSFDASASVDPARSLMVTEPAVLAKFPLKSVLKQILKKAKVDGPAPLEFYQRWWDSQNTKAGGVFPDAIHCDDQLDANGKPAINGFAIQCPRNEGALATSDPFLDVATNKDFMKPVAVVNRFDLAPLDGSSCGEYRIIYAKRSGEVDILDRNLFILEASLPNPDPSCGLAACRPVAEFWASLSEMDDVDERAEAIKDFYFKGLPGFRPVIHPANYGMRDHDGSRHGQIRSNQFMGGANNQIWQLREFQLDKTCDAHGACRLAVMPVTVKENPFGALFNVNFSDARTASFEAEFLSQVAPLSPQDTNALGMHTSDTFNAGQSNSQGAENDYAQSLQLGGATNPFSQAINAELASIGRTDLSAANVAARATTQSCGGCHQVSSGAALGGTAAGAPFQWPAHETPFTFVHVSETSKLSRPLTETFLPHRKQVLEDYLASTTCGSCSSVAGGSKAAVSAPSDGGRTIVRTLGGSVTH